MAGEGTNQATVYDSAEGKALRQVAWKLGARPTYFTKKIEFFRFGNGRLFLLEPDRNGQVNLGFKPGFGPAPAHPHIVVGKNSNVKSHWGLPTNEFSKLVVSDQGVPGAITTREAADLLARFAA